MKEKRNPPSEKPPNPPGDQLRQRNLKVSEKSTATGLRRAKECESCKDHLNHRPGHHSLRCLGRGWALRLRLWRSVLGRGLGFAVRGQPEGLRRGVPRAGEVCATGWGVECHGRGNPGEGLGLRRSKAPLLGRARGEGADCHRNLPMHMCGLSEGRAALTKGYRRLGASYVGCGWPGTSCVGWEQQGAKCDMVPLA